MGNFLRQLFKRLTTSKSKPNPFLRPPQLTYLEDRITPTTFTVNTNADSGTGSLRAAIDLANATPGDDIINFSITGTITLDSQNNTVPASLPTILDANATASGTGGTGTTVGTLTINGPDSSSLIISGLDGGNNNRDFNIFTIDTGGNLSISGVTVSGAQTTGSGGAFKNNGTLTVNDSTISGNSTTAVSTYGAGIANFGTLNISNSTLSNNSAFPSGASGGGAIFTSGTLNISNSTLSNNSANRGGGIDNFGTANVSNTTFFGNSATSDPGGAIFNFNAKTLNITNSTISNNSAPSDKGGGIFNQTTGTMNIANTIIANSISGGDYAGHGNIGTNTNNLVEDGSLTGASIGDPRLGSLQDNGGLTFTMALGAGSPAIGTTAGTGTDQRGINRTNNDIGAYSFGIQVTNTTDNLTSPSVGSLRAAINLANTTAGNDQISVNLTGANSYTITLAGALPTILDATALINGAPRGTLTITGLGASLLTIDGSLGGFSIFNIDTDGNLTISGVTVSGAQTEIGEGGAFRVNDSTLSIFDSIISNNKARIGGGIYSTYGNVTVNKSTLSGNFAISVENYGGGEGGGIANDDYSKLYVDNSTLTGNSATTNGGGIHNKFNGNITVTNSTIASNRADNGNGGGIFNSFNDTLGAGIATVTNSTISGNSANTGGGAGNIGILTISNSTISSNSTTQQGGGILNFGTLAVSNSTISGNSATNGGGFYNSGIATVADSTISGNSAHTGGGAGNIGTLTSSNSTLSGNFALSIGGALFNGLTGNLTVSNSTLSGNSAGGFGGGGMYNLGIATVTNSTLSGNSAGNGSGIYNYSGSINTATLSIANTIIANSTSGGDYAGNGTIGINTNNLVEDGTLPGTSEITGDPNLGPLQNNGGPNLTMALLNGSAAIGAGDSTISNAAPINGLDQRGFARNTSDIGAYSYNFASANDAVVSLDNSNQVVLTLSSSGTTLSDVNTLFNSVNNTLTITAATSGTLLTAPAAGIAGISIINGSTDTITLDLNTLVNFAGLVIVGNSGLDSVTIGAGGVDLSAVTTGAANQSFTANILGTSNSTSALVLTNAIKTKGTAATYLSAGTINGSGLITTPSITLLALSGIGDTMALNLAAASIAADSTTGRIDLNNTSSSAVTVTSLTSAGKTDPSGALITFDQSGGGTVTFNNVSTANSTAGKGWGAITLVNAGGGITVASTGVSSATTTSTISLTTTGSGNIAVNAPINAQAGDGNVSITSAGSISGTGLITGGAGTLSAQTGIDVHTFMPFGLLAISTISGDITINNGIYLNLPTISAPGNLTITASGTISQNGPITVAGTASFNAGNGEIDLTNNNNNFTGAVSLTNTGANNVAITDTNDITIGVTSLGTGTFAVTGSNIKLNNNVTTTNNSQTYTGNVVVNANNNGLPVTLSAGSGAINITGNIDSAAGHNYSLTINNPVNITNSGDVTIGGTIGNTQALGALLISGNDISLGNIGGASAGTTQNVSVQTVDLNSDTASITLTGTTYKTTGQQFYNSSALASIIGTTIISSYDGTRPITLLGGSAGSTINLTTAGISSNNAAEFTGLLDLNDRNLSINTTNNNVTTGGDITFNQTVNGLGTLTLNAGSIGNIIATGDIGATTPLTGVTITNAASAAFSGVIKSATINITDITDFDPLANIGLVNFQGDLIITTGMTIAANGAYNVKMIGFSNTIAGVTTFGNSGSLTFGDAGTDTFNFTGGIIATDPLEINLTGKVTAAGTGVITLGDSGTSINIKNGSGAIGGTSTGTITLGNAILEDNVTLTVGTGIANVINMAAVTGTASSPSRNLILNTTGAVTVAGAVGTDIGTLTITNSGGTTFQSTVAAATVTITNTTGTVKFEGNLNLITSLVTATQGYNVSITGTSNSIAGATTFLNTGTVTLGNGTNDSTTFAGGLVITAPSSIAIQGTVATTNTTMTLGDANTGITNNGTFSNPAILNAGTGIINLAGNVTGNGSNNPLKVITSGAGLTTVSGVNTAELQFSSGLVTIANPSDQTGGYRVLGGTLQGGSMAKVGYIYAQTGTSTLAPGINGPGMMHTNFLLLSSGNTVQIDLQGTIASTGYDQFVVCNSGNVNLASANLALTSTFTPASGTVFTIIDNQDPTTAIQGTFNGLAEGAVITANGSTYQISYVGGTGNDVTLTVYNPATVTSFSPTVGQTGVPVVITGSDFTKVSQVSFNGTVQPTYTVDSPTQITTTVPSGATTGTISITTIAGTATSTSSFTVDNTAPTLSISANPGSLKANETSTITFTFSEVVTGFSSSIITVTNGTLSSPVASSSTVYTAIFTPTLGIKADGTISVSNNYFDSVGNQGTAATLTPPIAINTIQTPLVTGSASTTQGGSSVVSLVDPDTGAIIGSAVPFPSFTGQIRVVSGDFNGDGKVDIIAAAGPGGGPAVAILDSETGEVLQSFFAFDPAFTGGVFIAVRDFNGDGILDIIAGAGAGGGPEVRIFNGDGLTVIKSFFAYAEDFTGGVSVASVDFNNDGILDLITGAGPGGAPHVKVYDGATNAIISQWYAYPVSFTGGVYVAAGDIGNDGNIEVVTGAGSGGAPVVAVWDPYTGALLAQFMAYAEDFTGGVRVGVSDGNFDGVLDLITGAGPGGGPQVNGFSFPTLDLLFSFFSGDPSSTGGVFVS